MPKSDSEQPPINALPPAPPLSPPAFMKPETEAPKEKDKPVAKVEETPQVVEEEKKLLSEDDKKAFTNVEEGSSAEAASSDSVKKQVSNKPAN